MIRYSTLSDNMPFIRNHIVLLGIAVLFVCTLYVDAEPLIDLADYEWRSGVGGSIESGLVYRVHLTADIFDGCKSFPLDLKVVDRDGRIFPSIVWAKKNKEDIYPVRIKSVQSAKVNEKEGYTFSQFKLRMQDSDAERPIHNRAIINLRGGTFVCRAEVWGGEDENHLKLLGAGVLVERKSPFGVRSRAIDYPDSTQPFIEVRVLDNEEGSLVKWRSTDLVHVLRSGEEGEPIALRIIEKPDDYKNDDGIASVFLDAGARHRPLMDMDIEVSADEYALPVRIYGRNDTTNSWRWVADGGVFKKGNLERSLLDVNGFDYRYIKVEFYHGDQDAPKIKKASAAVIPHFLFFVSRSEERAHLYFGSSQYLLPTAELSARINSGMRDDSENVSLGRRHANPARVAESLEKYRTTLFKLGVGILVLFSAIVLIRIVRNRLS